MIGASKNIWGFDPRSIGGCQLWLDAADSSSLVLSGTDVTQWNDKSGNARHVTQVTTGLRPTYSSVSNAIVFDGTRYLDIPNALAAITPTYTIFVVEKRASDQARFFVGGRVGSGGVALILGYNSSTISHHTTAAVSDMQVTIPSYLGASEPVRVTRFAYTGSTRSTFINGGQFSNSQSFSSTLTTWNNANVGAGFNTVSGNWYIGNVYEILFYNATLTSQQNQQIEGYLAHKWGLTAYYSPTTPLSISGCMLWLDGNDLSSDSMILTGNTVNTWKDKSGSGYNFTQASISTSLPSISNIGNGRGVYFGSLQGLNNTSLPFPTSYTIFAIANQLTNSGASAYQYILHSPHNADFIIFFGSLGGNFATFAGSATAWNDVTSNSPTSSIATTSSTSSLLCCTNNGTTLTPYFNTVAMTTKTGTNATTTGMIIGSTFAGYSPQVWLGTIGEILVYNSVLTTNQRKTIEEYLSKKWGLTTIYPTLPITHPYYSLKPCLRVFQPTDIAGCQLWLDGADLSSMTFSGSSITQWNDKSANGNNATISSGRIGATFSSVSNCVYFQASNVGYQTNYLANPINETMFIVANIDSPSSLNNNTLIAGQQGARSLGIGWNSTGATNICAYLNNEVAWRVSTPAGSYTPGTRALITGQVSGGTSLSIAMNGSTFSTGSESGFYANTKTYLGVDTTTTAYYYKGFVMEILFYNSVLTTSQRQRIEGYLTQKWGLTSSLPATHLFKTFPLATVTRPNFKELAYTGNDFNAYFAKYSPDGSVLWALRWVSTGGITFNDSATDSSGNVYVTGLYVNSSLLMYDTKGLLVKTLANSGGYDGFVAKYSSSGILLWTARHVGPGNNGYPTGVAVDSSGNVYAGGTWDGASVTLFSADEASSNTFGTTGGQTDGYIVKYNSSGIVQWSAKVVCTSYDQGGMSLKTDSSGNVYSVGINVFAAPTFYNANGTVGGSLLWGGTTEGMWLAKWNSSGTFQWALRFVTSDLNTGAGALSIDSSGNLYVSSAYDSTLTLKNTGDATAATMTNSGSYDAFIVKYSSAGSYIWNARIGGTGSTQEIANAIDGSGNVYVMGLYTGTLIVYTSGEASSTTLTNSGSYDHFIAKYTSAGVLVWATRIGSSGSEYNKGISVDLAGNVYTHGGHSATVTFFNVGGGIGGTLSNVGVDGYLAKYTTNGTFVWAALFGGPVTELSMRSITDPEGNIYLGGIYNSSPLTLNGV